MNTIRTLSIGLLLSLLLLPSQRLAAQESAKKQNSFWKSLSFSAAIYSGKLLKRGNELVISPDGQRYPVERSYLFSFEAGVQSKGQEAWQCVAKYPVYGIGVSRLKFQHRNEVGGPWAIYGFYRGFAVRQKRWNWQYKFAFGGSWDWEKQHIRSTDEDDIIGSDVNGYVEMSTTIGIQLSKLLSIETGFGLIHYSNGNSRLPQKGINVVASSLALRLQMAQCKMDDTALRNKPFKRKNEIYGYLAYGVREVDFNYSDPDAFTETYGLRYTMANLTIGFNHHLRPRLKLSGGFELNFDGTADAHPIFTSAEPKKGPVSFGKKTGFSFYGGIEWSEGPLALILHMGYDVVRTGSKDQFQYPRLYQRLGVKYHYTPNLFVGVSIRAFRYHVAKYIEWSLGARKDL